MQWVLSFFIWERCLNIYSFYALAAQVLLGAMSSELLYLSAVPQDLYFLRPCCSSTVGGNEFWASLSERGASTYIVFAPLLLKYRWGQWVLSFFIWARCLNIYTFKPLLLKCYWGQWVLSFFIWARCLNIYTFKTLLLKCCWGKWVLSFFVWARCLKIYTFYAPAAQVPLGAMSSELLYLSAVLQYL